MNTKVVALHGFQSRDYSQGFKNRTKVATHTVKVGANKLKAFYQKLTVVNKEGKIFLTLQPLIYKGGEFTGFLKLNDNLTIKQ